MSSSCGLAAELSVASDASGLGRALVFVGSLPVTAHVTAERRVASGKHPMTSSGDDSKARPFPGSWARNLAVLEMLKNVPRPV